MATALSEMCHAAPPFTAAEVGRAGRMARCERLRDIAGWRRQLRRGCSWQASGALARHAADHRRRGMPAATPRRRRRRRGSARARGIGRTGRPAAKPEKRAERRPRSGRVLAAVVAVVFAVLAATRRRRSSRRFPGLPVSSRSTSLPSPTSRARSSRARRARRDRRRRRARQHDRRTASPCRRSAFRCATRDRQRGLFLAGRADGGRARRRRARSASVRRWRRPLPGGEQVALSLAGRTGVAIGMR